jgi:hypothetical protein
LVYNFGGGTSTKTTLTYTGVTTAPAPIGSATAATNGTSNYIIVPADDYFTTSDPDDADGVIAITATFS